MRLTHISLSRGGLAYKKNKPLLCVWSKATDILPALGEGLDDIHPHWRIFRRVARSFISFPTWLLSHFAKSWIVQIWFVWVANAIAIFAGAPVLIVLGALGLPRFMASTAGQTPDLNAL